MYFFACASFLVVGIGPTTLVAQVIKNIFTVIGMTVLGGSGTAVNFLQISYQRSNSLKVGTHGRSPATYLKELIQVAILGVAKIFLVAQNGVSLL